MSPVVIGAGAPAVLARLECDLTRPWRLAICKGNRVQKLIVCNELRMKWSSFSHGLCSVTSCQILDLAGCIVTIT